MKHFIITTLLCLTFLFGNSQNGGQFFENNVIKVLYLGYSAGAHTFRVCNKQSCEARIRTKADQDPAVDIQVLTNSCQIVSVLRPNPGNIKFRVKAETSCPSFTNPDMGWLELNTGDFVLPLTYNIPVVIYPEGLKVTIANGILNTKFDNTNYYMHINVYDVSGANRYKNVAYVKKHQQIDLNSYFRIGVNFVEVIIETRSRYRFSFRLIK